MIENIEQAKERFKRLVDFYKLNDPNNYDYDDRDLISMKLVLEEIERLGNIVNEIRNVVNNEKVSGIEAKLIIKDILDKEYKL